MRHSKVSFLKKFRPLKPTALHIGIWAVILPWLVRSLRDVCSGDKVRCCRFYAFIPSNQAGCGRLSWREVFPSVNSTSHQRSRHSPWWWIRLLDGRRWFLSARCVLSFLPMLESSLAVSRLLTGRQVWSVNCERMRTCSSLQLPRICGSRIAYIVLEVRNRISFDFEFMEKFIFVMVPMCIRLFHKRINSHLKNICM